MIIGEIWAYNLGVAKGALAPLPGQAMGVGPFEIVLPDPGRYDDAVVIDTRTMSLLQGGLGDWLSDPRNLPQGVTADDIRAALIAHAGQTADPGAEAKPEGSAGPLAIPGETVVFALDASTAFAPETPQHEISMDALLAGIHPPLDPIHIVIA
jgi:hypothetical protein